MKVTLNYSENLYFIATARHLKDIHIDEPESFHGTDLGPSSVEYLLIGIGGCLGSTFMYCLQKKDVIIEDLEIVVDGKLTHSGPKMTLRLANVNIDITFSAKKNQSIEKIESCVKEFREYCIVSKSITNGLPINVNITKQMDK